MVDIYHSRRSHFRKCYYYCREERDSISNLNEYVMKTRPSGVFYAKESGTFNDQKNVINNAFMFDNNLITLETNDGIEGLKVNNIVLYEGKVWIVDSLAYEIHNKETQFGHVHAGTSYITLRTGK